MFDIVLKVFIKLKHMFMATRGTFGPKHFCLVSLVYRYWEWWSFTPIIRDALSLPTHPGLLRGPKDHNNVKVSRYQRDHGMILMVIF